MYAIRSYYAVRTSYHKTERLLRKKNRNWPERPLRFSNRKRKIARNQFAANDALNSFCMRDFLRAAAFLVMMPLRAAVSSSLVRARSMVSAEAESLVWTLATYFLALVRTELLTALFLIRRTSLCLCLLTADAFFTAKGDPHINLFDNNSKSRETRQDKNPLFLTPFFGFYLTIWPNFYIFLFNFVSRRIHMGGASTNSRTSVTTHKFFCSCGGEVVMKTLFRNNFV